MAYTQAQWNRIQSTLDPDARTSYLDYLKSADPAQYAKLTKSNPLQNFKTSESATTSGTDSSVSAAESAAAARAKLVAERAATGMTSSGQTPDDAYSTNKVGTTGKTQAQLDAEAGAIAAKTATDKAAADKAAAIAAKDKAVADAKTAAAKAVADAVQAGKTPAQLAAEAAAKAAADKAAADAKAAADKAAADAKAAADKIAADKIAADKAAADKAAAEAKAAADKALVDKALAEKAAIEKAAADKAAADKAALALLQQQIDALKAAGLLAEAQRVADEMKRLELQAANDAKAEKLRLETQYAYDMAAKEKADAIKIERVSAFQNLKLEFEKYGLGSLVDDVEALIMNGTPRSEAVLKLRKTSAYKLRFAGNEIRLAEGKNLYDESTYLELENDFRTSFEAYGQKALLGKTRESAQAMFAEYIGSDKSPDEIKNRIKLAVDEVSNRKDIRDEFLKYFPEITDSDLVSYFLKPKETLSALTAKVRVAQIGSAASAQGLNASLATATDLEQLGLTEQQARTGYQKIATDLPAIEKLGDIDKTDISQTTAENAYLKGLASEQRKIDQAAQRERNRFAESSGMNKVSLTSTKAAGLI